METFGNREAEIVLVQMTDEDELDRMEAETAEIQRLTGKDFCLLAVRTADWNSDLSPWPAPAVFGHEDFGNGAAGTLSEVLKICSDRKRTYILGGYSLGGLFALWAAYQTPVFRAVAAASPSVWFPGFVDYMRNNRPECGSVYLSLGDREEKARNPVLASVGDKIREAHAVLQEQGIPTILEWNPGNHFRDADSRTAKAFAWAMSRV